MYMAVHREKSRALTVAGSRPGLPVTMATAAGKWHRIFPLLEANNSHHLVLDRLPEGDALAAALTSRSWRDALYVRWPARPPNYQPMTLAQRLAELGLGRHEAAMEAEGIHTEDDLRLVSTEDGMCDGWLNPVECSRLRAWSGAFRLKRFRTRDAAVVCSVSRLLWARSLPEAPRWPLPPRHPPRSPIERWADANALPRAGRKQDEIVEVSVLDGAERQTYFKVRRKAKLQKLMDVYAQRCTGGCLQQRQPFAADDRFSFFLADGRRVYKHDTYELIGIRNGSVLFVTVSSEVEVPVEEDTAVICRKIAMADELEVLETMTAADTDHTSTEEEEEHEEMAGEQEEETDQQEEDEEHEEQEE
eukprot:SAG22_NODE_3912_length_1470_cov_1.485047_1_plen_360_part_10